MHSTPITLCARKPGNALIGLEDDGNILAENARITLQTGSARPGQVVLQKSSKLYGGPIVVQGPSGASLETMSGSILACSAIGLIESVSADAGSYCHLQCRTNPASVSRLRNGKVDIEISPDLH